MGVNVITAGEQKIKVEGVEEYIERYEKGEISKETLYELILAAPVVEDK